MEMLKLPFRKCKFCKHFDSLEKKEYGCYGKRYCPATEVNLVIENRMLRIVRVYEDAMMARDLDRAKKVLDAVSRLSNANQYRFFQVLKRGKNENGEFGGGGGKRGPEE